MACVGLCAVASGFALPAIAHGKPGEGDGARPNVIQIVLDDATREMIGPETTPAIWRQLVSKGAKFSQAIATSPLCCPSRASLMSGQYAHNNGVWSNQGGYPALVQPGNVLEVWLRRAGYKTVHVGKAMAGMPETYPLDVPPGWDEWYATRSHRYYKTRWWLNGRERKYGASERNHMTTMINRRALRVLRRSIGARRPLFLNIAHLAPHRTKLSIGDDVCAGRAQPAGAPKVPFDSVLPPRGAAFNEFDTTDKTPMVQAWPAIDAEREAEIVAEYRCAVASLAEVDRGVGRIVRTLRRNGALRSTAIILLSDNGFSWGEHRLALTKHFPYEEIIRVPLLIRLPGALGARRVTSGARVALIDVAPTIVKLARARPCLSSGRCRTLDGRSLLAAARGKRQGWHSRRTIGIELDRGGWVGDRWPCRYAAVRTLEGTYIRHYELTNADYACVPDDFVEVYDATADPYQLENLAVGFTAGGELERRLVDAFAAFSTCAGIRGRDPHPGAGRSWCE